MTVARKPGHRGERAISRKTIARGMPGVSGVTVVTNARVYYHTTRGCGRIGRPAFPAPSDPRAAIYRKNSRETGGEIADVCLDVMACDKREAFAQGSESDEAIHSCFLVALWIASLTFAMTIWLFENRISRVVPAKAGTHSHRCLLSRSRRPSCRNARPLTTLKPRSRQLAGNEFCLRFANHRPFVSKGHAASERLRCCVSRFWSRRFRC
jgi:hypothetical protein